MTAPLPPARCSALSVRAGEQLAGSAPQAVAWVALEQNGPWGAKAFTASHLDPALGRAIEAAAVTVGARPCLIRRPGRHADPAGRGPRRLLVACTLPGSTWLLSGNLDTPDAVLALDWAALAAGDVEAVSRSVPAVLSVETAPQLLVCTNGTRDLCCATLGRPVVSQAAAARPSQVWEVTHTSGHRFAPTAVLLPHGTLHGRLDGTSAVAVLDAAERGETVLAGHRGRSTWPAPAQVAELAVRARTGELRLGVLSVSRDGDGWRVRHSDGRRWRARVDRVPSGIERPESCAKPPIDMDQLSVEVTELGR